MSSYWIERTVPRKMESFCAVACLQPTVGTNLKVLPKTVHEATLIKKMLVSTRQRRFLALHAPERHLAFLSVEKMV